jgi:hypothetical protein
VMMVVLALLIKGWLLWVVQFAALFQAFARVLSPQIGIVN